ncbi:Coatomer subunit delta-1 [Bienertia sinuspersici]
MVVLAASIISKSGKALVSRQFVDMSRIRIEGLLAAFPKLVGTGKQHTYVETENVRYVYQPIEALYLVVVTNKQSNILEDLETLRMLSKLVSFYLACYRLEFVNCKALVFKISNFMSALIVSIVNRIYLHFCVLNHVSFLREFKNSYKDTRICFSLDEEGICRAAFELIFSFDEIISLGHKENVTVAQVKQYCEMESHEEKLHKLVIASKISDTKDVMKRKANEIEKKQAVVVRFWQWLWVWTVTDLDSFSSKSKGLFLLLSSQITQFILDINVKPGLRQRISERYCLRWVLSRPTAAPTAPSKNLGMKLGKSQGANKFLESLKAEGEVESSANPSVLFKTHPNINKELYANESVLGLKDPNRPFPVAKEMVLASLGGECRAQMNLLFHCQVINCWPSVSGSDTDVSIEYEASSLFDLQNVVISIPLPALREPPNVTEVQGDWRFDPRNSVLEWSIVLIDDSNRSGSLEFVVPAADPSTFFPISVRFTATNTFSDLKVTNILPLKGGSPPKFSQRIQLVTENYQVV